MSLHWYKPKGLAIADLEIMGVTIRPLSGDARAFVDVETRLVLVDVGSVTAYKDGRVVVWPLRCPGLPHAMPALLTSAEDALMGRMAPSEGWSRRRTKSSSYKVCTVLVTVPKAHELSIALRRAGLIEADLDDEIMRRIRSEAAA